MKKIVFAVIVLTAFVAFGGYTDCNTTCSGNCCYETCCSHYNDGSGWPRSKCTTCTTCCYGSGSFQNCDTNCY